MIPKIYRGWAWGMHYKVIPRGVEIEEVDMCRIDEGRDPADPMLAEHRGC
jgi:hypothetical protein